MRVIKESDYYMTQEEVAKALGISRKYVSEIERRAIKKLKAIILASQQDQTHRVGNTC